jgi:hypothetical protein
MSLYQGKKQEKANKIAPIPISFFDKTKERIKSFNFFSGTK